MQNLRLIEKGSNKSSLKVIKANEAGTVKADSDSDIYFFYKQPKESIFKVCQDTP